MKPILVFLLTTALTFSAKGYAQDTIYSQTVGQATFWWQKGVIILTQDSVMFDIKKKKRVIHVSFSYKEIKSVERYSYLWSLPVMILFLNPLFEHGIEMKMKDGDRYYFFTFKKRKKIVEIIRSKIAK